MNETTPIAPGRYRHYKGKEYVVLGTARHSETQEDLVIYRQDYGDRGLWVRPKQMFLETVKADGQEVPRFQYLRPKGEGGQENTKNLFHDLPQHLPDELFQTILAAANVRIERIVSQGHASPEGFWFDQDQHEWVVLLKGFARLRFEGNDEPVEMKPGDFVKIPAHERHRVDWTTPDEPTIWLALYYEEQPVKTITFGSTLLVATLLAAQDQSPALDAADTLFRAGKFGEADKAYGEIAAKDPKSFRAIVRLGVLAQLSNRLADSEKWLQKAIQLNPKETSAKLLLAEVFRRLDKFDRAAPLLQAAGNEAQAKTLESFKGQTPYELQTTAQSTALKFVVTDPLPLVRVRVNGKADATFLIDTGASDVVLDPEFAMQVGAKEFGGTTGTFAGGKTAKFQHGRIDSLTLGDFEIKNVPIDVLDTRRFSPIFGGKQIDGIIGTVLFYHFLATLDYPRGELVLRKNTEEHRLELEKDKKAIVIPFWMVLDHYMVAWGKIEKLPTLLFVDTGLAGGGLTCPESVLKEAGIKLAEGPAGKGIGGGGEVKVEPFNVKELSLGDAREENVRGLFLGAFPLENAFGFRIEGIISHGFFRPYAVTFDFTGMRLILKRQS
jgi:tetratricopeptide (TPR) repeat protein